MLTVKFINIFIADKITSFFVRQSLVQSVDILNGRSITMSNLLHRVQL